MSKLTFYDYQATEAELLDLNQRICRAAAKGAKIDAERLSLLHLKVVGVRFNDEEPYVRAESCWTLLDGKNFPLYGHGKIKWCLQQMMIWKVRFKPDPARLKVRETFHWGA